MYSRFHRRGKRDKVHIDEVIAKVRNLPFDKLRVNGLRLKSLTFSVRGELVEPQKNTFAIGSDVKITLNATPDFVGEPHCGLPERAATVGRPYGSDGFHPQGSRVSPRPWDITMDFFIGPYKSLQETPLGSPRKCTEWGKSQNTQGFLSSLFFQRRGHTLLPS